MLGEIAIIVGLLLVAVGVFFKRLPEPDHRFDDYSAARRITSRRAAPLLWAAGSVITVLGVGAVLI